MNEQVRRDGPGDGERFGPGRSRSTRKLAGPCSNACRAVERSCRRRGGGVSATRHDRRGGAPGRPERIGEEEPMIVVAAWSFAVLAALVVAFQIALAAGAPWGRFTQGGVHTGR